MLASVSFMNVKSVEWGQGEAFLRAAYWPNNRIHSIFKAHSIQPLLPGLAIMQLESQIVMCPLEGDVPTLITF